MQRMNGLTGSVVENAVAIGADCARFELLNLVDVDSRAEASAQYVYCSGIDAWTVAEFRRVLAATMRILKPTGIIRVATRDLDAVVYGYLLDRESSQPAGMTRAQQLNAWRKSETAEFVFNEEDLGSELRQAGFVDIWRLSAGASSVEIFRDCERQESSDLVLEARKPASMND
jgi:predicted SAM-dependent methyltransferase